MKIRIWRSACLVPAMLVTFMLGDAQAQSGPGRSNGALQYNNGGVFAGDTITTNGAGVLNLNAATISGHSAPTANAILGTNNGLAKSFYLYHTTRSNLFIGFTDPINQFPNPTGSFNTDIGMRAGVNLYDGPGKCVSQGGSWPVDHKRHLQHYDGRQFAGRRKYQFDRDRRHTVL